MALKHLGPRFLSLQLPGFSLLLLDLILACNVVLSSSDLSKTTPRSEAVSILGGLLSLPDDFTQLTVLEPTQNIQMVSCPDIKVCLGGGGGVCTSTNGGCDLRTM